MKDIIKSNPVRDYQNNFINNFINEYLSSTNIIVNNIENMDRISSINTVEKLRTLNIQMENLLSNIKILEIDTIENKLDNNIKLTNYEKNILENDNNINNFIKELLPDIVNKRYL